jgi:hypothetical protein
VKVSSREGIKVVNCEGRMEILIRYDDGTTEIVEARPEANIVSTWMSFRPGIQLVSEPKFCRWGSDFFSTAINEGNLRSGRETPFEDEEASILGFNWKITGSEKEDCQDMMVRWIERLGGDFDPERPADEYFYGGLLRILAEGEADAYSNDQKCWMFYLDEPRNDAAHHLRLAGLEPNW